MPFTWTASQATTLGWVKIGAWTSVVIFGMLTTGSLFWGVIRSDVGYICTAIISVIVEAPLLIAALSLSGSGPWPIQFAETVPQDRGRQGLPPW